MLILNRLLKQGFSFLETHDEVSYCISSDLEIVVTNYDENDFVFKMVLKDELLPFNQTKRLVVVYAQEQSNEESSISIQFDKFYPYFDSAETIENYKKLLTKVHAVQMAAIEFVEDVKVTQKKDK